MAGHLECVLQLKSLLPLLPLVAVEQGLCSHHPSEVMEMMIFNRLWKRVQQFQHASAEVSSNKNYYLPCPRGLKLAQNGIKHPYLQSTK